MRPARKSTILWTAGAVALLTLVEGRLRTLSADPPGHASDTLLDEARRLSSAGAVAEAEDRLRAILAHDPDHALAFAELTGLAKRRPLTLDSESYRAARDALSRGFVEYETSRYVVFSDADVAWTREMCEHLERAHHQFQRISRRLDLRPLPLRHKLVCILFDERAAYRSFAARHDDVDSSWIAGYYSPRWDRIVFYSVRSNPSVAEARARLGEMERTASELEIDARNAGSSGELELARVLRDGARSYRSHVDGERRRVDAFTMRVNTATTLHEAVHQLCFHTGVQNPRVQYPLWLSEGIATVFESEDPAAAFGPEHEYAPRRDRFEELLASDALLPLGELVTLTGIPEGGRRTIDAVYHESYALLTWMFRYRRDDLRRYLMAYRTEPAGLVEPARHAEIFTAAFGDPDAVQRQWLRHERAD